MEKRKVLTFYFTNYNILSDRITVPFFKMNFQIRMSSKALRAQFTSKWPDTGVSQQMLFQIKIPLKSFEADMA